MSTHNDDDDIIGGLIAAGVLIAIGYGVYRVIKSFGSYSNGDTVNSDQILSPGTEEDTQIAYVKYGYKLYNMQDSQLGYVQYGYKLFTMSDSQVGYLKYGYKIYNQAEIQIGYVKYGYKLYDMDDDPFTDGVPCDSDGFCCVGDDPDPSCSCENYESDNVCPECGCDLNVEECDCE